MSETGDYAATFTLMDTDGDGLISAPEIKALFSALGQELTDEAVTTMLGFVDADDDGKVTLEELTAYMARSDR